ncbi:MAG: translation initiation factor IF-6 [Romboutsia sp.]|nr:translation initiation factor IF-6 [Romboutsia sp.]
MLKRTDLTGNPNLGVYISVNDDVAIVPLNLPDEKQDIIRETLNVEVIKTSIAGSNLIGALSVGNSNGFLVSPYIEDRELETLESAGLNIIKLKDKFTAVGNVIALNDTAAMVNPSLSKDSIKTIENELNVEVVPASISKLDIIGSLITVTNKGFLLYRDSTPAEVNFVEETFKVQGDIGTVGRGITLVGACSIANKSGVIVGENTTGPEMARLEESLGFLD